MDVYFGDIQDISTIDYPGEVVSVLFFCGCPMRCPFCQNFNLLNYSDCQKVSVEKIIDHIKDSAPFITGIAVTGGEPSQQIDQLIEIISKVKKLDLLTKIDTNGYYPKNLKTICDLDIVDYFAMDIKNELTPKSYAKATGLSSISGNKLINRIKQSIQTIINSNAIFEARTTIVPSINDSDKVIENICENISGVNRYVLQQFRCIDQVLDKKFADVPSPTREQLIHYAEIAKNYIDDIRIRTAEHGEERI
ncbi:MAG: anaerobic ribonucleoside-triphosphate reductase activating protein [Candidatus Helarchaeota archaeon]